MPDGTRFEHPRTEERQRAIVDLAYRLDPTFAKSLISLLDNDPARAKARDKLQRQFDVKEARRELVKDEDVETRLLQLKPRDVAELCWSLPGGLNSGRVATLKATSTIPYVQMASMTSFGGLRQTYPVMAWAIQNSVQRHEDTPYAATHLVELFNATVFACELAMRVISRAAGVQQNISTQTNDQRRWRYCCPRG